jgi:kynurenine formamidase
LPEAEAEMHRSSIPCLSLILLLSACAPSPTDRTRSVAQDDAPAATQGSTPAVAQGGAPSVAAALASLSPEKILDLTYPFDAATIYWPTGDPFRLRRDSEGTNADGSWYASFSLSMSEHGGTHIDAPYHFSQEGWTADRIPPRVLIGPAVVIDVRAACEADPDHAVTWEEIQAFEESHGKIPERALVVFYTGWGKRWPDRRRYLGDDTPNDDSNLHFPGLSAGAALYLVNLGRVAAVGFDTASIDPGNSRDFQAHQILAAANIYNLENLDQLEMLPSTGATLIALPMKIGGGSGGPVRVVALLP